ncbi:MAG: amidohydrolase family protein, partial [Firmicutes bacterium]|nr:amidohydrolase family protein [Bacillota bacterium]
LCKELGIQVSMGHSEATYECAGKAVDRGASRMTHTFNAMRPLDHRESGVLGAVLMDDRVQCEMIADFVHVSPEVCMMIYKLKGADKVTLISDSCSLAGLKQEDLPSDMPYIIGKAAYLKNGTLCGSVGTVMTCVRNMVSVGVPLEEAVKMASLNPARDLRVDDRLGSIEVGKWATFVLVDDDLNVKAVYVKGKLIQ